MSFLEFVSEGLQKDEIKVVMMGAKLQINWVEDGSLSNFPGSALYPILSNGGLWIDKIEIRIMKIRLWISRIELPSYFSIWGTNYKGKSVDKLN